MRKLRLLKDQILERWEDLFERSRTWWAGLSPREKIILGSASGVFGAILIVFVLKTLTTVLTETSRRAESLTENGRRIQSLIQQVNETRTQSQRFDTLMGSLKDTSSLKEYIDRQANRYGVMIAQSKPPTTPSTLATPEDEVLEIQLGTDTSLSAALNFLEAVQNRLGVRILQLRMMPDLTDRQKMNVDALIAKRKSDSEATP